MGTGKNSPRALGKKVRRAQSETLVFTRPSSVKTEAELFAELTEGERVSALRILMEDPRVSNMAKVGRYRVIAVEPVVAKPPHVLAGKRLATIVAYDYASDRSVHACVDLIDSAVASLQHSRAQPMLSSEEEMTAIDIALRDDRVAKALALGDEPIAAMHYWCDRQSDLSYSRRAAAVIFGPVDSRPSLVAIVNLLDSQVVDLVPANEW